MAKARARTTAKKVKDKWRSKNWYQILAPNLFNAVPVAETLAETPEQLLGRVTEVSMQDLTGDFRKSHIKLFFKINKLEGGNAYTTFDGHTLTSDYIRRMIRRRKSRIDGVYSVETRDGASMRVKPFAITEKRIQHSQKRIIRNIMNDTIQKEGRTKTLNEFIRDLLDGKTGVEIYKNCKVYYPVKRIEIYKTELDRLPTIQIEEEKPAAPEEPVQSEVEPASELPEQPTTIQETSQAPEQLAEIPVEPTSEPVVVPETRATQPEEKPKRRILRRKKEPIASEKPEENTKELDEKKESEETPTE